MDNLDIQIVDSLTVNLNQEEYSTEGQVLNSIDVYVEDEQLLFDAALTLDSINLYTRETPDIISFDTKGIMDGISKLESLIEKTSKEATLLAKVAELKETLNTIDFTAIEQAIQGVENITAKEATLIQGVSDIIKAVENIDFTDLENSIEEVKNAVANIDFSAIAKENTLLVESKAIKDKIDAIEIPVTDLTEVAKENTLVQGIASISQKVDNIVIPEIDTTPLAKEDTLTQGVNTISQKIDDIHMPELDKSDLAKEATLSSGISTLSNKIDNIDLSSVENKVDEGVETLSNKIDNIDLSAVENKVQEESTAIQNKIDNIKLPEIDTTELAKESTLQEESATIQSRIDNIDLTPIENKVDEGVSTLSTKIDNIDLSSVAKQGENQDATNSKILEGINSIANSMVTSLQEKVVTPQKYTQEVTPDNDKVALKKVTVLGYTPEVVKIDNSEFEIPENIKVDINKITTENVRAEYACAVGLLFPLSTKNINLNFADAYYTCDGAFYNFITEHAFPEDIYPSKWIVAYFKMETAVMNISGWSPQEIFVRGHLGGIQSSEAGITEKILIPDGSSVGFIDMTNTQLLTQSIKNVRMDKPATMVYRNTSAYGVFDIAVEELTQGVLIKDYVLNARVLSFSKLKKIDGGKVIENYNVSSTPLVEVLDFPELEECLSGSKTNNNGDLTQAMSFINFPLVNLCKINVPKLRVIKTPLYYGNNKKQEKIESIDLPSVEVITCEVISSNILNLLTNLKRITFSKLKECASELYYINVTIPLRMEYPELERIALPYNKESGVQNYIAIRTPENVYAPKLKICDLTYSWQYTGVFSDTTTRDVFDFFPTIEEVITSPYEGAIFDNIKSSSIIMPSLKRVSVCSRGYYSRCAFFSSRSKIGTISSISLPSIESYKLKTSYNANYKVNVDRFYLGCKGNPTDLVYLDAGVADTYTTDIEIGEGARQKISIINYNGLTAENIALHILDKLADNTDGETIPIIIGSTNLARINASEYAQYVAAAQAKNYTIA